MAMFGIGHTKNTIVGDHFVRGVSGGEWVSLQADKTPLMTDENESPSRKLHFRVHLSSAGIIQLEDSTRPTLYNSAKLYEPPPSSLRPLQLLPSTKPLNLLMINSTR